MENREHMRGMSPSAHTYAFLILIDGAVAIAAVVIAIIKLV